MLADIIILKNGKQYEGKIINQTREKIQIQLEEGKNLNIDKNEIQRVIYSPTSEEMRKREEELRRLEEMKKEERRRLEEIKKQEEEQRRLEEQKRLEKRKLEELTKLKQTKEPLLKNNKLVIDFGPVMSNNKLSFEKIQTDFNKLIFFGSLLFGEGSHYVEMRGLKSFTSKADISVAFGYHYNQWMFQIESIDFSIKPLFRDVRYYTLNKGESFEPSIGIPRPYLNFSFTSSPIRNNTKTRYTVNQIYAKYLYDKYNFGGIVSFFSVPIGFRNHILDINFVNYESEYSILDRKNSLFYINLIATTGEADTIFSGFSLKNYIKKELSWEIDLFVYYGDCSYLGNHSMNNFFNQTIINFDYRVRGRQRGQDFTNRFEKEIYKNTILFIKITYYEALSKITNFRPTGYEIDILNKRFKDYSYISEILNKNLLSGKEKTIIAIDKYVMIGIRYQLDL